MAWVGQKYDLRRRRVLLFPVLQFFLTSIADHFQVNKQDFLQVFQGSGIEKYPDMKSKKRGGHRPSSPTFDPSFSGGNMRGNIRGHIDQTSPTDFSYFFSRSLSVS